MHIEVAETVARLSLFAVDGTFVKTIGAGYVDGNLLDVLCLGHDIFVADNWYSRVCVFSSKTGAFIRSWGAYGKADGQFRKVKIVQSTRGNQRNCAISNRIV